MIEIKHDGPTMVVSQDNLADATKDGTWRLLATYATTVKETIYGKYNYATNYQEPNREEFVQRQFFVLGQTEAGAIAAANLDRVAAVEARTASEGRERDLLKTLSDMQDASAAHEKRIKVLEADLKFEKDRADSFLASSRKGEMALADLRQKYKTLRAEVGEARARELLGET